MMAAAGATAPAVAPAAEQPAALIRTASLCEALAVLAQVPELDQGGSAAACRQRLAGREHLILVAELEGRAVAFKIGYALSSELFYSWVGGVLPAFRRRQLAAAVLDAQQDWAQRRGYRRIQVKSGHRFPAMLQLLASRGYRAGEPAEVAGKLLFERRLG